MGIRGGSATPDDAVRSLVWTAIAEQIDAAASESAFVSVADTPTATFAKLRRAWAAAEQLSGCGNNWQAILQAPAPPELPLTTTSPSVGCVVR